ncbi:uncharacterized protein K452DRAFT_232600 [Aplosporella prunicola CBS 121167]|uniref:Major facilitator superfamily (MFS) profile domain-containing protein n=1 Tax=Aplosporella prunicola CBS 121167 TaxID=1176127 RepID=A0A6A6B512_9PEZI|nr:uncharacterized protein K452DRAFT_232600 [Aplosporella prunicola CBS 121167]KAF2139259.1 hypothetical protein K452DRAFT_232600 [Aplosporella prunicola CBS 121167]
MAGEEADIATVQPDHSKDCDDAEKQHNVTSTPSSASFVEEGPSSNQPPLARHDTKASNALQRTPTVVPRKQRRGLFANLCLIPEVSNPYEYSRKTKWTLTFIVALSGAAAPTGSGIIFPALEDIARSLDSTTTIANMSVSFYMLAMSIFPLWWSSFSETLGRRTIYLTSFALFILWAVLCAISDNISMLIVMRVLSGGASASVQAVGGGTIADIWETRERGFAMGIFYLGPLCGPLLAPIVGGALAEGLGWRSTQWFLVIYGGVVWLSVAFMLPETLRRNKPVVVAPENGNSQNNEESSEAADPLADANTPEQVEAAAGGLEKPTSTPAAAARPSLHRVSTRQSVQKNTKKYLVYVRRCFIDPLRIILYLRFPAIFLVVSYATVTFASLYILNISIETTFSAVPYSFSTIIVGLLYIPNSLGYIMASLLGGRWIDGIMHREARKRGQYDASNKLVLRPEDRMRENAWAGALLFPGALLWYGWTAEKGVFWLVPMIANFFFGIGSMLIFAMATTMLTEFMPRKASNGIALNNFARNIFSCIGSVVTDPAIRAIGNGWLFTAVALVCFAWGPVCILLMLRYSEQWRKSMERHPIFLS